MVQNFISVTNSLKKNTVHIKDAENVNKIISQIIKGGGSDLQVVSDFDRTITKQHHEGVDSFSSFAIFSHCPSITKEYLEAERKLNEKYIPLENCPNISLEEKIKYMEEWWILSEEILKGLKVSRKEIDEVATKLDPKLRDGTVDMFKRLNKLNIPLLVFSAGLGDTVESVLKHHQLLLPNVKVIGNFLNYDENGAILGFKKSPPINVFNKNEFLLRGTDYYESILNRSNVIVMGDSLGDARMSDGISHANAVLKIGFLYKHVQENLQNYMETFDIVLEDDQSMNVVNDIIQEIS